MTADMLLMAPAASAAPSVGIGLLAALIDAGACAGVVALVAFVVITATMTQALA
jgi:hypothetical protein